MCHIKAVYSNNTKEWNKQLEKMQLYDFYHLAGYHKIAEKNGEGKAVLFSYKENEYHIALPLLVRPVPEIDGMSNQAAQYYDATSVYGYAGPMSSDSDISSDVVERFQKELTTALSEMNVITVFSRLHPFIQQDYLLSGIGKITNEGVTISIDLSLPVDIQRQNYSKGHKSGVNKLRKLGVECFIDTDYRYMDDFLELYYETMNRVHATDYYYFNREHFETLINDLEANVYLFICKLDNKVICGGIYIECHGIVQSYLGGMYSEYRNIAPRKLEKDTVRIWATENNFKTFHLGGGVGAKKDSLFEFKSGFSKTRHDFKVWKWIIDEEKYRRMCKAKDINVGTELYDESFFPAYRAPIVTNVTEKV